MLSFKEFLNSEVKPALGCTEPGAVALAVARAVEELNSRDSVKSIKLVLSDSVYKNGLAVGIPGAMGAKGNVLAAAIGAICGHSEYGLESLKDCERESVDRARSWVSEGRISVICDNNRHGVYVEAHVSDGTKEVICLIEREHSNITKLTVDDAVLIDNSSFSVSSNRNASVSERVSAMSYNDLMSLANEMDEEDIDVLMKGVSLNMAAAEYGLRDGSLSGISLGKMLKNLIAREFIADDLSFDIKAHCYAASDARMAGAQIAIMSSAGSGNHGITAIIPIAVASARLGKGRRETALALAISHLTTSYVKSRVGRLTPVCGCSVAAGSGAAAGLVSLLGGDIDKGVQAMQLVLANLVGMICDGAKETCSLKVGTAAMEAYCSAMLCVHGEGFLPSQGIVGANILETVENVAKLNKEGMSELDGVIIDILTSRGACPL